MTRQVIYSRLEGRPFVWEYLGFRLYDSEEINAQLSYLMVSQEVGVNPQYGIYQKDEVVGQVFKAPGTQTTLTKIELLMRKAGSDLQVSVELWDVDQSTWVPTSLLKTLGQLDWASVPTYPNVGWAAAWEGSETLTPNRYYAVCLKVNAVNTDYGNRLEVYEAKEGRETSGNPYPDGVKLTSSDGGQTWSKHDLYDLSFRLHFPDEYVDSFTWPTLNTVSEKRLEYQLDFQASFEVNGQAVSPLTRDTPIPQAEQYTVRIRPQPGQSGTIQRRLMYNFYSKPRITPGDFGFTDAYLHSVQYLEDGSLLRIDDSPDSQLQGNAGQEDIFQDVLVPWRSLEWRSGRGRVLALGVV